MLTFRPLSIRSHKVVVGEAFDRAELAVRNFHVIYQRES